MLKVTVTWPEGPWQFTNDETDVPVDMTRDDNAIINDQSPGTVSLRTVKEYSCTHMENMSLPKFIMCLSEFCEDEEQVAAARAIQALPEVTNALIGLVEVIESDINLLGNKQIHLAHNTAIRALYKAGAIVTIA